jgi:uncharacterized protein
VLRQVRRKVLIALVSVLACWLGLAVVAFFAQGMLIFPVPASASVPTARKGTLLRLPSEAGEVVALHFAAAGGEPTVVVFHGNGEELADVEDWAWQLHTHGLGALAVEYPGYGLAKAAGAPSEQGCYQAAEVALAHLREKLGVGPDRTVLSGHSLGSAVAAEMALRGRGARLVLLSPITSIDDEARQMLPFLPTGLLLRHHFATLSKAARIAVPTLIVHGARDDVAPVWMGERLSRALPNAKLVVVPGGGHDLLWPRLVPLAACVNEFAHGRECRL